ncbi:MAG: phospholipase D-like domain-containing protein [bacterium]
MIHKFFSKNSELYSSMLEDIGNAQKYVYLETYNFSNDEIGEKFRDKLIGTTRRGVEVKILCDDFGSKANKKFFKELTAVGGKVKFFRKFRLSFRIIRKNNHRDHRKLLVIDDKISYIGSSNITKDNLKWRDSNLRLEGKIAQEFKSAFLKNYSIAHKYIFIRRDHIKPFIFDDFVIQRDVPSIKFRRIQKKHLELIKKARKKIIIETPYFLPDWKLRRGLKKAVEKGVEIIIMLPNNSDIKLIDILRQKYFGQLYEHGIKIMFYRPEILHSKCLVVDDKYFSIGSANLDYRSSMHQFEINLFGQDTAIINELKNFFEEGLKKCEPFCYQTWLDRSKLQKMLENILISIRYLF